jgi:dihydrofolate reductase
MKKLNISIVACINKRLALGLNNDLLYRLPSDLAHFKSLTRGGVVIMGKNTFDSLPIKPLKDRVNIVITKDQDFTHDGVIVVHSIEECLSVCQSDYSDKSIFVIGGSSIYRQFLVADVVTSMVITEVFDDKAGDVYFPNIFNEGLWILEDEFPQKRMEGDEACYVIKNYVKKV